MELLKYHNRPENWDDLIKEYDTKTLFHESSWHEHILTIHPTSRIEYFYIRDNKKTIGYFCGQVLRKGIFKIMGSPLGGTGTNYMGPIVNNNIDQEELVLAIDKMCKSQRIAHIEVSNDLLEPQVMTNYGFDMHSNVTNKVLIADTEEDALKNLRSVCRNRIRKAQKNELNAEVTYDPSIIRHFYDQFKEVYGKQGMVTPFGQDRVQSLVKTLPTGKRLLPLWVKMNDTVIATGLFPHDEHAIYFWGAASWLKYQKFCPNEVLHWTVIRFAVKNNIKEYNMCGGKSQFKNKFGGKDVDYLTFSKSYLPFLKYLRNLYRKTHYFKLKVKGKLKSPLRNNV